MKICLFLLLTLLAFEQDASGYRILGVFPVPGKSHWLMMEQIMIGLARRGHQVDVVSHFPREKPLPNYTDISLAGTAPLATNRITAKEVQSFSSASVRNLTHMVGVKVCELLQLPQFQKIIKDPPKDPPYDLVITELFVAPCFMAFGRHLNVPMVGTVCSTLHDWINYYVGNPLNPSFVPSLFSGSGQTMTFWERLKNTLLTTLITFQIDYYTSYQQEHVKASFGIDTPITDFYQDMSLVLVNSHHSLHGIRPMTHGVVEVGGVHVPENGDPLRPEVKKWLDESQNGCVLFTFGSMVRIETFPEHIIKEIYQAFERIAPVRVLMKVAKKEDLLPGLPKNVMIQPWFSQIEIFKHNNTKAFITHGGLMGTTEAIYYGIPMVGIPLFGDQHINIANYVKKKVAVSLGSPEAITAEKLYGALKTVLHDPIYLENIKKLQALFNDRLIKPLDQAIYWIEYVAKYGNILQSPVTKLNWWQRNLIDVYAFIAFCAIVALGAVVLILLTVNKLIFGSKSCPKRKDSKKNK